MQGVKAADDRSGPNDNEGSGTARDLRELIATLKERMHKRFGMALEEEVQRV